MALRNVTAGLALLVAACGGGPGPPGGGPTPPASGSCAGPVPANASPCPGADLDLASDVPRSLAEACGAPCSYTCYTGYRLEAGTCVAERTVPRPAAFTDNGDGTVTVTDALGSATWLKEASCADRSGGVTAAGGVASWGEAQAWASGLAAGVCGLRDGSAAGDWSVPTLGQLLHLSQDLAAPNPFLDFHGGEYWSSWAGDLGGDFQGELARAVDMDAGICLVEPQAAPLNVWAVHGS
jgi:hypothetical protein